MTKTKDELLELGIHKLKTFGFVNVTKKNVLEDEVYLYHFKKFMSFHLGQNKDLDKSIKEILTSLHQTHETT